MRNQSPPDAVPFTTIGPTLVVASNKGPNEPQVTRHDSLARDEGPQIYWPQGIHVFMRLYGSDRPKHASALLFGGSFGRIRFGKNFQDSANTEASVNYRSFGKSPRLR